MKSLSGLHKIVIFMFFIVLNIFSQSFIGILSKINFLTIIMDLWIFGIIALISTVLYFVLRKRKPSIVIAFVISTFTFINILINYISSKFGDGVILLVTSLIILIFIIIGIIGMKDILKQF